MPQTIQEISVTISEELTLTPLAGASLVNEIIKGLLYQKCQIPYPYSWLKHVIEKRRKNLQSNDNEGPPKKPNFTHEAHYRKVSAAFDYLDVVMRGINREFCETDNAIKEIVVLFGTSPICSKEVFTITIPNLARGHIERNHVAQLNKNLQKVLRTIFLSQSWMDSIDATVSCTNTYIYIKKQVKVDSAFVSEGFEYSQPPQISQNTKHFKFCISYNPSESTNCCDDLVIFEENCIERKKVTQGSASNIEEHIVWCRCRGLLKGFKDCFVNKVSVCELW
ncbi:unnamed protein product [Ceutorhynchus assimilis]|uniref:Uncharacterized protein n=1 Tax=Ceutorhynchus assimilis TaxID=467358 RepID=A0A9N9MQA6_9CUCU|nr:unnamed protein product [Ceutorhynchus assimilis]